MDGNEDTIFSTVGLTDTYFEGKIMAEELASGDNLTVRVYNRNDGVSHYPFDSDVVDYVSGNNGTIIYNSALVGLYKFEGNENDSSTTNATPTLTGTATFVSGKEGRAFSFNGSTYISYGNPTALQFAKTNTFSICGWIKTSLGVSQEVIVAKESSGGDGYYIDVLSGNLRFVFFSSGSGYVTSSSSTINDGNWHYFSCTFDGSGNRSGMKVYIDGVLSNTGTASAIGGDITNSVNFTVGAFSNGANQFTGTMDEIRVYNAQLSAAQVSALYMVGKYGQSHTFDSSGGANGEYISIGNPTNLQFERTDSFTITGWIKPSGAGSFNTIITKIGGSPFAGYQIFSRADLSNKLQVIIANNQIGGSQNEINISSSIAITSNIWTHFVVSYDGSSTATGINIYINGVIDSSPTINFNNLNASITNSGNFLIGNDGLGDFFSGQMDDLRLYNRALSAADVTDLYNNPAPMKSLLYSKSYGGPLSPTNVIFVPYITSRQYTLTCQQTTSTYYKTINGELMSVT